MKKLVTYTKSGRTPTIGFTGLTEADAGGVNTFRQVAKEIFEAINLAAKQYQLTKSHRGKAMTFNFSGDGYDDYGTYKLWNFPIFVRNKDELIITVKVWTDETHGGSCVMSCAPYAFRDLPSAAQFETQVNSALIHAEKMVKRYTLKNLPK